MYFQIELHVEVGGAIAEMSVGSIAFKKVKGRAAKTRSLFASKKYLGHIFQSSFKWQGGFLHFLLSLSLGM